MLHKICLLYIYYYIYILISEPFKSDNAANKNTLYCSSLSTLSWESVRPLIRPSKLLHPARHNMQRLGWVLMPLLRQSCRCLKGWILSHGSNPCHWLPLDLLSRNIGNVPMDRWKGMRRWDRKFRSVKIT